MAAVPLVGLPTDRILQRPQPVVEATAPEGLIEAFGGTGPGFLRAVQWHRQWRVTPHPFYRGIFQSFGEACR